MDDLIKEIQNNILSLEKQLNSLDEQQSLYHNKIISITSKNPEYAEMIQFIVELNDKIENKERNMLYILNDILNQIMQVQIKHTNTIQNFYDKIEELKKTNEPSDFFPPQTFEETKNNNFNILEYIKNAIIFLKEDKFVLTFIIILIMFLGFVTMPDVTKDFLRELKDFIK